MNEIQQQYSIQSLNFHLLLIKKPLKLPSNFPKTLMPPQRFNLWQVYMLFTI